MLSKLRLLILLSCFLIFPTAAFSLGSSSVWYADEPYIIGGQTWQISYYNDEYIYFANNDGLLQFDGDQWKVYKPQNKSYVRSVFPDNENGRIYIGGINEFGYFSPDPSGVLKYTCLSDALGEKKFLGNIWGIHVLDGIVYAQGDYSVLKKSFNDVKVINSKTHLNCSNLIGGVLYLGTDSGLLQLNGERIIGAYGAEVLNGKRVRGIIPYDGGMLVATAYDGIYRYDGSVLTAMPTSVDADMRKDELFSIAAAGDNLAVGTVQRGVLTVNMQTGETSSYNSGNGLEANTVLSLCYDKSGNLWVGLDGYINCISLSDGITLINNKNYDIGLGYVVSTYGPNLYLGTNRGLYRYGGDFKNALAGTGNLTHLLSLGGQVWGLENIGDDMFCMHDRGLFRVEGDSVEKIDGVGGAWTIIGYPGRPDKALVGTYDGILILSKNGGKWSVTGGVGDFTESSFNMQVSDDGEIFVHKDNTCVYKIKVDIETGRVISRKELGLKDGLPSLDNIKIAKIGGKIFIASEKGIYRYDKDNRRFVEDVEMNRRLGGKDRVKYLVQKGDVIYALGNERIVRAYLDGDKPAETRQIAPYFEKKTHMGRILYPLDENVVIYPTRSGGYAIVDFSETNVSASHTIGARINSMTVIGEQSDSVVYENNFAGVKPVIKLPYSENSLKIHYGVKSPESEGITGYMFRLNDSEWSAPTLGNVKEYTDLREGKYRFEVKALLADGSEAADFILFEISAPWYRTTLAYIAYLLSAIIFIYYMNRIARAHIQKKQSKIIEEKQHEIETQKKVFQQENEIKDRTIERLEQDKLQSELDHKSQEIVNLLMSLSSKNEILINLKEELKKLYGKMSGNVDARKSLMEIQTRITDNIQSDDIMKRVETEFDLINDNFMKKLRQNYPDLSNNEIMMCAYIKMNLLTKEIAPLLNISVRGVETMRYRIRKKFGLDRDESLVEFLMKEL